MINHPLFNNIKQELNYSSNNHISPLENDLLYISLKDKFKTDDYEKCYKQFTSEDNYYILKYICKLNILKYLFGAGLINYTPIITEFPYYYNSNIENISKEKFEKYFNRKKKLLV